MKMYRMRQLMLAAVVAVITTGCASYNTRFKTGLQPGGETKQQPSTFYVYGLVGEQTVDFAEVCPNGVAGVETKMTIGDKLITAFTVGIYSPMTVTVECAGGSAYQLTPDEENHRTYVSPVS